MEEQEHIVDEFRAEDSSRVTGARNFLEFGVGHDSLQFKPTYRRPDPSYWK